MPVEFFQYTSHVSHEYHVINHVNYVRTLCAFISATKTVCNLKRIYKKKKTSRRKLSLHPFFLIIICAIFYNFYNFNIFASLNMGEFLICDSFKSLFSCFKGFFFYFNTIYVFHTWGSQGSKKKSTKMSLTEFLADQCMYGRVLMSLFNK
jgi:hypothetical protein